MATTARSKGRKHISSCSEYIHVAGACIIRVGRGGDVPASNLHITKLNKRVLHSSKCYHDEGFRITSTSKKFNSLLFFFFRLDAMANNYMQVSSLENRLTSIQQKIENITDLLSSHLQG